jgi:hypothetical protein
MAVPATDSLRGGIQQLLGRLVDVQEAMLGIENEDRGTDGFKKVGMQLSIRFEAPNLDLLTAQLGFEHLQSQLQALLFIDTSHETTILSAGNWRFV